MLTYLYIFIKDFSNFGPKENWSNVEPFIYGMKGFHPFKMFDSLEDLKGITSYSLTNHILSCHK